MPSRVKTFQIPVTRVYRTKSAVDRPQLESIAQLTPMARAPPAGSVFATALDPRLTVAAWRHFSWGRTARMVTQYEIMLAAATTATISTCGQVIMWILAHTLR